MRYTVVWTRAALNALADAWTQAQDRAAVTDASDRVDPELEVDPDTKRVDFYGDRLLIVDSYLHIVYRVESAARRVTVLDVWWTG